MENLDTNSIRITQFHFHCPIEHRRRRRFQVVTTIALKPKSLLIESTILNSAENLRLNRTFLDYGEHYFKYI
jgi:hypothetical protein